MKWYYYLIIEKVYCMEMIVMKKLISVALVLVMLFAVTAASASALDSPGGKKYHSITTSAEGQGTASSDKNKVDKEPATPEDGYVTLTAVEDGGYFTKWVMDGTYNIITGDEYSDVFVIEPTSDIHAIANFSVDKDNLTAFVSVEGDGTASSDPTTVAKGSDGTFTLKAVDGKDKFTAWTISGEYEIVSGDLNSRELVIRPLTDIYAVAKFVGEGSTEPVTPTENPNKDNTSPKTGDPTMMFVVLALAAMGLGVFAVKKIKE